MRKKRDGLFKILHHICLICVIILGLLTIVGTGDSGSGDSVVENPDNDTVGPSAMATFNSEEGLEVYLKEQYATSVLSVDAYPEYQAVIGDEGGAADTAEGSSADTDNGFSQTNVQEAGVDESDKVKTDGTYMYVTGQQTVAVVKAVPSNSMGVIQKIDVPGHVDSLYLYNDILVVLYMPDGGSGSNWGGTDLVGTADIGMPYWIPVNSRTGVLLVDIAEPSNPVMIENVEMDGSLVSSRLTGGKLHIIQQFLPDVPPLQLYYYGSDEDRAQVEALNRQRLESVTLDDLLPSYTVINDQGQTIESERLVAPEDFYRPAGPGGGSIATVTTFNLNDLSQPFQSVGIVADIHVVYASTKALYLAATKWGNMPLTDEGYSTKTEIHKFDLTGEKVSSMGSGSVWGKILNQFSLGEYNDVLRIATTTGNTWNSTSKNHVFCLEASEEGLVIIGNIKDMAPGERIYSARFIGPRGFLVTFVKVDPLFTLDLSDPTDPKVLGELKVPGYSDYIHPFGENHLITIGKDTKEEDGTAWYQGVQVSIFDVTDFADPVRLYSELIGDRGTTSEALYNHKAFTFWAKKGLLAIPVDVFEHETEPDYPWISGTHTFTGLYVYRVTIENGFVFLGRISTDSASGQGYYYSSDWNRGVFIGESVYAVKSGAIRSAIVEDIEATVNTLIFDVEL